MQSLKFSDIIDDTRKLYSNAEPLTPCSETHNLVEYVYGDLGNGPAAETMRHIEQCTTCRIAMLKIEADLTLWELEMAASPEKALSNALSIKGQKVVQRMMCPTSTPITSLSSVKEPVSSWISQVWAPKWAGQTVTAVDIPEQRHHFDMGDGEYVNICCQWEGRQTQKKPYLRVSWNANIFSHSRIWVQFVDLETEKSIDRIFIGTALEGCLVTYEPDLKFDPSIIKWGLRIDIEQAE